MRGEDTLMAHIVCVKYMPQLQIFLNFRSNFVVSWHSGIAVLFSSTKAASRPERENCGIGLSCHIAQLLVVKVFVQEFFQGIALEGVAAFYSL